MSDIGDAFQGLGTFVAGVALIVTVRAMVQGKRTDVLIDSHKRFDVLMVERARLLQSFAETGSGELYGKQRVIELKSFSTRFWSLQFDQFLWWRQGFVSTSVFRYWMQSRYSEFVQDPTKLLPPEANLFDSVYGHGWRHVEETWQNKTGFLPFMRMVRENRIESAMHLYGPSLMVVAGIA